MSRPVRIALLTEIPSPYRLPLFNTLDRRAEVEVEVLFLANHDPKRPYRLYEEEMRFGNRTLRGWNVVRGGRWLRINHGVTASMRRFRPDVVIVGGWNQPAFWLARRYARRQRLPLVAWVESTARDARPENGLLERAKRSMIGSCSAFLVPGEASAEYLVSLGVERSQIAVAPNAVDLTIFRDAVATARTERDAIRERLGLVRATALYVGRLDPEKGVDVLLAAVAGLDADVIVVGSGSDEPALRASAPANVRFLGWLDRDDLVPWFAAADVFVLPSRSEQWGMVLNEAAAAGLPLVASAAAGAAWDLIEDGVSGARVAPGDAEELREALASYLADAELREAAGRATTLRAAGHTPEAWATAVATLADSLASPDKSPKHHS
ncbi:MAG: glycosyltransferase [Actinobacteria bacterium]|uniref:Unannotated protein n=1 Tax=freshwater metagenome TaxID=449393 RepID=A0A6J6QEA0_9ZZZZ|nr:glycosyltransferase [Actinomycetota bacterium]